MNNKMLIVAISSLISSLVLIKSLDVKDATASLIEALADGDNYYFGEPANNDWMQGLKLTGVYIPTEKYTSYGYGISWSLSPNFYIQKGINYKVIYCCVWTGDSDDYCNPSIDSSEC